MERDLTRIVSKDNVDAIFLCEVGNMRSPIKGLFSLQQEAAEHGGATQSVESLKDVFDNILYRKNLSSWEVITDAPYVALLDIGVWHLEFQERFSCGKPPHFVQHLILKHSMTGKYVRVFNNHSPTPLASSIPKKRIS